MSSKQRDVYRSEIFLTPLQVSLCGLVYLFVLQHHVLCCPAICHMCSEKQVNCRSLGLNSVPRNFPKTTTLVYLSGNNITNLSANEFAELKELAVLYLDNSRISYIHPKAFFSQKKLYNLYLNDNYIQNLDAGIFDALFDLQYLHLQQNQIYSLVQGLFRYLKSVRYLTLQKNRLHVLNSDVFFGMVSLHTLNLANNNISRISDTAFRHLENLENLYLQGNHLMQVPSNALGLLKGLKRLSLSNNQIGSIHNFAFRGLNSLQYLVLENANIHTINGKSFSGLNNLKQLILSRNDLHILDSRTFTYLNHLLYLQLDRNSIRAISDDTFENMGASLKVLNLAFNKLTSLQPRVLQPLVSLTHFQASYNPWHCGCSLLVLRSFLLTSSYRFSVHCETPPQLRNRPLGNVKYGEFQNCTVTTANPLPIRSTQEYMATTEELHSHWKGVTHRLVSSSQSTNVPLSKQSAFAESSSITQSHILQSTTEPSHKKILLQLPPVNLSSSGEGQLSPDVVTVSLKPTVICQQKAKSLNQSFHILLSFFILSCVAIVFLIFKFIQLKRQLRTPEHQGDNMLEYYSCYQSGRYHVTDHIPITPQNSFSSPVIDLIRPLKQSPPDAQTQVILFEHSAL